MDAVEWRISFIFLVSSLTIRYIPKKMQKKSHFLHFFVKFFEILTSFSSFLL